LAALAELTTEVMITSDGKRSRWIVNKIMSVIGLVEG